MGRFIPPYMGPGERLFAQGASIQARIGPFTVRPDDIRKEKEGRQYIGQVVGIIRYLQTTFVGNALITAIASYNKPVLVFPLVQLDEDGGAMAWVYPRWGLFPVVMSFSPLFGQRLRKFLGGNEDEFEKVFTPHETFVHEMVHVARAVSGNYARLGDENEEELAAIVTNMFSFAINRPLISSYDEMTVVKGSAAEFSRKVADEYADIIAAFCKQNRKLAYELSNAKVAFNPLRTYIDENL
jgi:hypothetical protein